VRVNVDVVVDDPRARRRWLTATPDTYRLRRSADFGPVPPYFDLFPGDAWPAGDAGEIGVLANAATIRSVREDAARLLSDADVAAGVVGEVAPPRLAGRRRAEPVVAPVAIAVRREAWLEVSGAPEGPRPLPGLLARLRASGGRIGLVPVPPAGTRAARDDPVPSPAVVILAAVPMHDVGGGGRGAQMAREFLRRGWHVTFVALFASDETVDLGLRYLHPRLEEVRLAEFDARQLAGRVGGDRGRLALVQVPADRVVEPVATLAEGGFRVVYDLIDDWSDRSLGAEWYRPGTEAEIVRHAHGLTASSPDLVAALARHGREARLVPNGVDDTLFSPGPGRPPLDLPVGEGPLLGYHGSLYGDWFDWESVAALAGAFPEARIVLIGDHGKGHPDMPPTVHFLGLKPQTDLAAYLAHLDAGIVPFAVTPVTHAVSPLKVFEYLACGVPVAAPPLRALDGLEGVHTDPDLAAAVTAALAAPRPDPAHAAAAHGWGGRLERLVSTVGLDLGLRTGTGPEVIRRPVIHWDAAARKG
jgi:glycosyltransferase involved in cell wall biosynthesis